MEESQKGIEFGIKEQEALVSLPLLFHLCKSLSFLLSLMTSSIGREKLKPLVPRNLKANQKEKKKKKSHFIKKPNSAELHSNFTRRMKQRHSDLMQIPSRMTPPRILEQWTQPVEQKSRTAPSGRTLIDWIQAGGSLRSNFIKLINTSLPDTYTTRKRAGSNCRGKCNY